MAWVVVASSRTHCSPLRSDGTRSASSRRPSSLSWASSFTTADLRASLSVASKPALPKREERPGGREEESWRYWSLKTRKAKGSEAEVLKRTSPEEWWETEKEKEVALRRTKTRSEEVAAERWHWEWQSDGGGARVCSGREQWGGEGDRRGMRSAGTSHRRWLASVIWT
ncbi:uncharacterized protein LOC108956672 [Eucalyptus grandis]|uniref:uncharacterized protein LOC108956672 n=1 Tax=Eucalyptus grandis TaxID=71139 RepID=UPI00192EF54C|nr:uncharacterized protein LOC108956672 [Eucalyptus grandis]